jgi:hypothetical protein
VQSEGVAAAVKHFVCNDVESRRTTGSVEIDEETLREIPSAVRDGLARSERMGGHVLGSSSARATPARGERLHLRISQTCGNVARCDRLPGSVQTNAAH